MFSLVFCFSKRVFLCISCCTKTQRFACLPASASLVLGSPPLPGPLTTGHNMVLRAPHTFDQQLTWLHVPSCFPLAPPTALLLMLLKSAGPAGLWYLARKEGRKALVLMHLVPQLKLLLSRPLNKQLTFQWTLSKQVSSLPSSFLPP